MGIEYRIVLIPGPVLGRTYSSPTSPFGVKQAGTEGSGPIRTGHTRFISPLDKRPRGFGSPQMGTHPHRGVPNLVRVHLMGECRTEEEHAVTKGNISGRLKYSTIGGPPDSKVVKSRAESRNKMRGYKRLHGNL